MTTILSLVAILFVQVGDSPTMKARLYAANEAVAPGGSTELAIELEVTPRWHFYHPIVLDTGFATKVDFEVSGGASVRNLRWPTPTLAEALKQEYLGYEGKIYLLATLDVDKSAPVGKPIEIKASVSGLACIEACIPVEAETTLRVPVGEAAGKLGHEKLFADAREAMPKALAEAAYIKGTRLTASQTKIPVKGKGELAAVIQIEKNHTIQHREPGVDTLIPTRLFIESVDGVKLGKEIWPDVKAVHIEGVGDVRKLEGTVVIRIPVEINDEKFEPREVALRALVQYQACTKEGTCFPPEMAEGSVSFEVIPAGEAAVSNDDPVFAVAGASGGSTPNVNGEQGNAGGNGPAVTGSAGNAPGDEQAKAPMEASRLLLVFLAAFVGGAILNVMPCVLPVLSLKILSFMQQAGENHSRVFAMGLVYGAGVMASFAVLGAVMVSVGLAWGGFMQDPLYVLILCTVVFAFALSLLGVWELHLPGIVENVAGSVTTREGYGGAFLNGLMATALATPCVAPFLGTAIGTLVSLPGPIAFSGIMVAGLGMATPYVLLTAFPGWLRFLPKPGKWMITFKQFMGFVLLGTCVWLLWVLQFLVQPVMLVGSLAFLTFVALGCWMIGKLSLSATAARTLSTYSTACVAMVVGWYIGFEWLAGGVGFDADPPTLAADEEWRPWRPGIEEELSQQGYTVYVDYTAQWCTTCQYNKATVLKTDPVKSKLKELGVVMIEADFTRKNPEILKALRKRNRAGVPLNVLIPAGNPAQEIVLPELLTSSIVLDALQKAGPSKVKSMAAGQQPARALGAGQPAR